MSWFEEQQIKRDETGEYGCLIMFEIFRKLSKSFGNGEVRKGKAPDCGPLRGVGPQAVYPIVKRSIPVVKTLSAFYITWSAAAC